MKKTILSLTIVFAVMAFTSCKKCQTCTTKVEQTVFGITTNVSTSQEYCGDEYDNAPAESNVTNNVGGINQEVTITCEKS